MEKETSKKNIEKTPSTDGQVEKDVSIQTGGKVLNGVVVSDKMTDTIVVKVQRFVKHPKYGKYMKISKKIKAHDAGNTKKIGDKVTIKETRPISKDKSFILLK